MFEWLVDEMGSVNTPKFFCVDGVASNELREAVEKTPIYIPPSYKEFVLRFGNAELYRKPPGVYLVRVFGSLRETTSKSHEPLFQFGRTDTSLGYFKGALLVEGEESPVFVWRHDQGLRKEAGTFEEWLQRSCRAAKNRFKKSEWRAIVEGPAPFSNREKAIVEARRKFSWRTVGISKDGDLIFEVHNGSDMVIPYLSIGVREKQGPCIGGISLPVFSVMPGQTRIIHRDCYKDRHRPDEIEVFAKADPGPEDRQFYWEFKAGPQAQ